MKRLMPTSLITFLMNNPNAIKADCFAITLPTGVTMYATEGQWDITLKFPSFISGVAVSGTPGWEDSPTTFKASEHGMWKRGAITSEASYKLNANTMSLTCVPNADTTFPGLSVPLLSAAFNHLFEGATVKVYTVYMPLGGYGNTLAGLEVKWQGTITKNTELSRSLVTFECADPMFLLSMKIPSAVLDSNCPWAFADVNCSLDPADYTTTFTNDIFVSSGPQYTLGPGAGPGLGQPDGYFTQGVITCLTGANAGLSQSVKSQTGSVITLMMPFLFPIGSGDTFSVIKGCDKTPETCAGMTHIDGTAEAQDFRVRFRGTPFSPPPSASV